MRVLAYFGIFLSIFCPWNTSKWSHNNMHGLKLKLVGSFSNNQHSWVILRPTIEKKLRVNIMYFIQCNFAHFWLGFRALAPKRGCWRMVFLINSECPNIILVGKIDKPYGLFCLIVSPYSTLWLFRLKAVFHLSLSLACFVLVLA